LNKKGELFQNKYRIKSARLSHWNYSHGGYYFVTICTKDRICLFGNVKDGKMNMSWQGKIIEKFWTELNNNHLGIKLDDFTIMPNHIHGIIVLHGNIETINKTDRNNVETIYGVDHYNVETICGVETIHGVDHNNAETICGVETIHGVDHNNAETICGVETIHELSLREKNDKNIGNRIIRRKMLIPKIIGRFKMQTTKEINIIQKTIGNKLWQPRYYDRIIRNKNELRNIKRYIKNNPEKWELDLNYL